MVEVYNPNPTIFAPTKASRAAPLWLHDAESDANADESDDAPEPIDNEEIFDLIRSIADPEHPNTLEELRVVSAPQISIQGNRVHVEFTPTVPHCGMSTLIGLSIRVRLLRALPSRFKVDITLKPGSHQSELAVNKQLNDKERVAAALENPALVQTVEHTLENAYRRGQPTMTTGQDMVPRLYQEEILERAQQENIIAALDTGTGKTFISLLLIKWISSTRTNAKTVFLVPKAALVQQQAEFITSKSALRVDRLWGAMADIPLSDKEAWQRKLSLHDVAVMTPQILVNLLTHGLWSMEQISLLIFDECHHTQKSHPYNVIMRGYFQLSDSVRPKIFGMTASPIWNIRDVLGSMAVLERSLDAAIVTVSRHLKEMHVYTPKAVEEVKLYKVQVDANLTWTLMDYLDVFVTLFDQLSIDWDSVRRRHHSTRNNLGLHCASLCVYLEVTCALQKADLKELVFIGIADEVAQVQSILNEYVYLVEPGSMSLTHCSNKLYTLVDILLAHMTSDSYGIVFVEQRQTAACLAHLLPLIPELVGLVRCGALLGHKEGNDSLPVIFGSNLTPQETIQAFRERHINLVIATSVADEGLDFPACNLVVRFDAMHHIIDYVQSRGRARTEASTFVVMVEEGNKAELNRYQLFTEKEPTLKLLYEEDRDTGANDPNELTPRESFAIGSTGAILTYDNAGAILSKLCSRLPRDVVHQPKYSGDFEVTLVLPPSLCLPREELCYTGPAKKSKREAKRAVAFAAVKRLFELGVLDERLLPCPKTVVDDAAVVAQVEQIPKMMGVLVKDPWTTTHSDELWIHTIKIAEQCVAGLITGTRLVPAKLKSIFSLEGQRLNFNMSPSDARELLYRYTKECIWTRISSSPIAHPLNFYIVPVLDSQPDWAAIHQFLAPPNPDIEKTWQHISESHYGRILVRNVNLTGHIFLLRSIRRDLSPMSTPPADAVEAGFPTYREYWTQKWTGRQDTRNYGPFVPLDGPLLELIPVSRLTPPDLSARPVLYPLGCCRIIDIPHGLQDVLLVLPALYRRLTSVYRAGQLRKSLSLPPISDNILVEALTIPSANVDYSNQRLETLGDAVLQLCTSVHVFNQLPFANEGELSKGRQNCVSNRFLLYRGKEIGIESFLICETMGMKLWLSDIQRNPSDSHGERCVARELPRRSLQETMESILGASYITGGIDMALATGQALGMNLGGAVPWQVRYAKANSPVPDMFYDLQERLGYSFNSGVLLLEALTHPSFDNQATNSYQRLEFLGDAVIYLVVMDYMYRTFPDSTPDQLAWPRTRAVAAPAQAMLAIKRLKLDKLLLANNVALSKEIDDWVPRLANCSGEEIIKCGWKYDPPKALSDVFESVIGAVLVDSHYDWDKTSAVVEYCMEEVLPVLGPFVPRDPVTELLEWAAKAGCRIDKHIDFRKSAEGVSVWAHNVYVCGPIEGTGSVAKQLAAVDALPLLKNCLENVCNCTRNAS
ncbi:hypothetical protein MIND_01007600 [Mycena indigotica]|uniref:Uncharacterized protein n=1 Tax=Mycena indigotica TaxID=2126181 RepID=A0A8H6VUS6_9AGAR|nr:uncharacterized protein MIND_01007600 [Mycena indigotica]KAF7294704.1 hypothetical protein MIND_01007600 [Mycena indigotica]